MTDAQEIDNAGSNFTQALDAAARLPGVRINRTAYLRTALKRYCSEEQIKTAIADGPAAAGTRPWFTAWMSKAALFAPPPRGCGAVK